MVAVFGSVLWFGVQVFSGFLRLNYRGITGEDSLVDLLVNELARVFNDKCLPQDRYKVLDIISDGLRINFEVINCPKHKSYVNANIKSYQCYNTYMYSINILCAWCLTIPKT